MISPVCASNDRHHSDVLIEGPVSSGAGTFSALRSMRALHESGDVDLVDVFERWFFLRCWFVDPVVRSDVLLGLLEGVDVLLVGDVVLVAECCSHLIRCHSHGVGAGLQPNGLLVRVWRLRVSCASGRSISSRLPVDLAEDQVVDRRESSVVVLGAMLSLLPSVPRLELPRSSWLLLVVVLLAGCRP